MLFVDVGVVAVFFVDVVVVALVVHEAPPHKQQNIMR